MEKDDLTRYFSGGRLYGDDFDLAGLEAWYEDEKEAYADLGAKDRSSYRYVYHALNKYHGFRHLSRPTYQHALGFGGAYGDEFYPIADRVQRITIVEPSGAFEGHDVFGIPTTFVKPTVEGSLSFGEGSFDLVTCLDVLHHIPNVSRVVAELGRVLRVGGEAVIREPVISMGDWRVPRRGLTKRERGIPEDLLDGMIASSGLEILHASFCMFPVIPLLCNAVGITAFNSQVATRIDAFFSKLFKRNLTYHATTFLKKFRPAVKFYVARKLDAASSRS